MKSDCAIIIERTAFEVALSTMVTGHRQALRDPHWCMLLPRIHPDSRSRPPG